MTYEAYFNDPENERLRSRVQELWTHWTRNSPERYTEEVWKGRDPKLEMMNAVRILKGQTLFKPSDIDA